VNIDYYFVALGFRPEISISCVGQLYFVCLSVYVCLLCRGRNKIKIVITAAARHISCRKSFRIIRPQRVADVGQGNC